MQPKPFNIGHKFLMVLAVALLGATGYFAIGALGDTQLAMTLENNARLRQGLIGHWTFDGKDFTTTTTVRDIGSGSNDGTLIGFSAGGGAGGGTTLSQIGVDGVSAGSSQTSALTINKNPGTQAGDLILAATSGDDAGFELPADFTELSEYNDTTNTNHTRLGYKIAGASEPNSYTANATSASERGGLILWTLRGQKDSGFLSVGTTVQATGQSSVTFDDLTTTGDNAYVFALVSTGNGERSFSSASASWSLQQDNPSPPGGSGTANTSLFLLRRGPESTGTYGGYATISGGSSSVQGVLLAVYPEPTVEDNQASPATEGPVGQAVAFDGTDDFVDVGNTGLGAGSVKTVAFWMKAATINANAKLIDIDGTDQIETDGSGALQATSFPGTVMKYIDGSPASATLPDTDWHHVVITTTSGVNATDLDIGRIEGEGHFGGAIDDVRLYDRVLSVEDITRLYELGATTRVGVTLEGSQKSKDGLVGHWTFDGDTVAYNAFATTTVFDRSPFANHGNIGAGSGAACSGSHSYTTPGTYTLSVGAEKVGCTATITVKGGGGASQTIISGGTGGGSRFEGVPDAAGDFNILVGAGGNINGTAAIGGGGGGQAGGGGASAVVFNGTLLSIVGGGGGAAQEAAKNGGSLNDAGGGIEVGGGYNIGGEGKGGGGDGGSNGGNGQSSRYPGGSGYALFTVSGGGGGTTATGFASGGGGGYGGGGGGSTYSGGGGGGYLNTAVTSNASAVFGGAGGQNGTAGEHGSVTIVWSAAGGESGGVAFTPGILGQGMRFSGSEEIDLGNNSSLELTLPATITFWMKGDELANGPGLVQTDRFGGGTNSYYGLHVRIDQISGKVNMAYGDGTGTGSNDRRSKSGTTALKEDTWYHVAAVWRGPTDMTLYINGEDDGGSYSGTGGAVAYSNAPARLGTSQGNNFTGTMDDVRFYSRALSAEEVGRLYGLGATTRVGKTITTNPDLERGLVSHWTFDGKDIDWANGAAEVRDRAGMHHGNASAGLTSGAASVPGVIGQGMRIAGSTYETVAVADSGSALDAKASFSVAAWAKLGATSVNHYLLYKSHSVSPWEGWELSAYSTGNLQFMVTNTAGSYFYAGWIGPYLAQEWYHIVGVKEGTNLTIYVNGQEATDYRTTFSGTVVDGNTSLHIGATANNNFTIDDVRFYSRALSAEEVRRLYEMGR